MIEWKIPNENGNDVWFKRKNGWQLTYYQTIGIERRKSYTIPMTIRCQESWHRDCKNRKKRKICICYCFDWYIRTSFIIVISQNCLSHAPTMFLLCLEPWLKQHFLTNKFTIKGISTEHFVPLAHQYAKYVHQITKMVGNQNFAIRL